MILYLVRVFVVLAVISVVVMAGRGLAEYVLFHIVWSRPFGLALVTFGVATPIGLWLDGRDLRPRPARADAAGGLLPRQRRADGARR